jgi:restriction endonuclease S subunit
MNVAFKTRPLAELFGISRKTFVPGGRPSALFLHYSIPAWDESGRPVSELGAEIGSAKIQVSIPGILVSKLNPRIPRVIQVEPQEGQNACASTEFIYYTPYDSAINLRFYYHYFSSRFFQKRLEAIAIGSTNSQTRAKPSETLIWGIPHPLPDQQRRISEILDTADEAIANTEAVIEKLKMVRAGMMHDLLTRGLDKNGKLRPPASEAPKLYKEECGEFIPKDWDVKPLAALGITTSGGTPNRQVAKYWDGGIPWIKTAEIDYRLITAAEETISEKGLKESSAKLIPSGMILMAMYGEGITRGRVAILGIDATINQACLAISPGPSLNRDFLYWSLVYSYRRLRDLSNDGSQKNLNAALVGSFPIAHPIDKDLREQSAIAEALGASSTRAAIFGRRVTTQIGRSGHRFAKALRKATDSGKRSPPPFQRRKVSFLRRRPSSASSLSAAATGSCFTKL